MMKTTLDFTWEAIICSLDAKTLKIYQISRFQPALSCDSHFVRQMPPQCFQFTVGLLFALIFLSLLKEYTFPFDHLIRKQKRSHV